MRGTSCVWFLWFVPIDVLGKLNSISTLMCIEYFLEKFSARSPNNRRTWHQVVGIKALLSCRGTKKQDKKRTILKTSIFHLDVTPVYSKVTTYNLVIADSKVKDQLSNTSITCNKRTNCSVNSSFYGFTINTNKICLVMVFLANFQARPLLLDHHRFEAWKHR